MKTVHALKGENKIITTQSDILNVQRIIYKKIYTTDEIDTDLDSEFFSTPILKLTDEEKGKCEGLLTEHECQAALKDMKNQKSPGSDGFTAEFYKIFWNDLKFLSMQCNAMQ